MRSKPKLNNKESSQSALRVSVQGSKNTATFTQEAEQESKNTYCQAGQFDGNAEQVPPKSQKSKHAG